MILSKQATEFRKLPLSWSRKLSNAEFTSFSSTLLHSVEQILGQNITLDNVLNEVKKANNELSKLRPIITSHHATEMINQWHAQRKRLLTGMTVLTGNKANYQYMEVENKEEYIFLNNWFPSYGKRLYDLGINGLTGVIHWIREDYNTSEEFRNAIDLCFHREYNDIIELTDKIMQAQLERSIDYGNARPVRGYTEVRRDVLAQWQIFISLIVGKISWSKDVDQMIHIYNTLSYFITEYRSLVRERETKRQNKKQRQAVAPHAEETRNTDKVTINQPSEKKEKVAVIEPTYHQKEKLDIGTTTPEEVNVSVMRWHKGNWKQLE